MIREQFNKIIYIDSNNLHRASIDLGFKINYKKFYGWLKQKFNVNIIYIFIGFVDDNKDLYDYLENCGFVLIFKETFPNENKIKGNCDSEIVLKIVSDFYIRDFDKCILISGDGDFGCIIEFLSNKKAVNCIVAPDVHKCSFLLKNKNTEIIFLNDHYYKFSEIINKKAPDADSSA